MRYVLLLLWFAVFKRSTATDTCNCKLESVEQLLRSVIQQYMNENGLMETIKKSKELQHTEGSYTTEKRVQQMIDENLQEQIGYGELCYMGMESRLIPNHAITASSYTDYQHAPYMGRLDSRRTTNDQGSWSTPAASIGEWLQVDFGKVKKVAGVITQGRVGYGNQFVRSYKVSCGEDWNLVFVQHNGQPKVFEGNTDVDTKVYNRFPEIHSCRFIRIYPQSWNEHISMRVEFVPGACYDHLPPFVTKSKHV